MSIAKVAVVQAGSVPYDTPQTVDMVRAQAARCAGQGAQLIVFPEALIGGYPKGEDFGVQIGKRSTEGREQFRRYFDSAIEVPGPVATELAQVALACQAYLVIGVVERALGTLYCTVLFFNPGGLLMGKHRKVMPTAMERVIWGCGDGSTLPVFETPLGRLGAVICWENYMPLLRMHMYAKGIQLYCAPTVDDRASWIPSMQHIAVEGRCFVFSACQFVPAIGGTTVRPGSANLASVPPLIRGGSMIVDPFGKIMQGPIYDVEATLIAEIDLNRTVEGKFDLDVAGHYARPGIFRLEVNESASS
jgi:nitrilase